MTGAIALGALLGLAGCASHRSDEASTALDAQPEQRANANSGQTQAHSDAPDELEPALPGGEQALRSGSGSLPRLEFAGVSTIAQLAQASDALVVAAPVGETDEEYGRARQGIGAGVETVWRGREFEVLQVLHGSSVESGDRITMLRTGFEVTQHVVDLVSGAESEKHLSTEMAEYSANVVDVFDGQAYVFGLVTPATDRIDVAGPVFTTYAGPHGLVRLVDADGSFSVAAPRDSEESLIQTEQAGESLADVASELE